MTTTPHTIGVEQTLAKADKVMHELRVRHLPVLSGGKLIGILTDRDVKLVESLRDVNPRLIPTSSLQLRRFLMYAPRWP
jgi:acetoin utilization protein AcuB